MNNTGSAGNNHKTILLVDDETSWLEAMTDALSQESYEVISADSGEAALQKLGSMRPDLILSDVRMPVMNGFDLYELVKKDPRLNSIPYVFMSSIDDFDAKHVAKELGVDDYVVKPFDSEDAKTIVYELLQRFKSK